MKALFAIWGPRLFGVIASFVVGKAAERGLTLDPAEVTTLAIATYALMHRLVSKKVNPGDAAKAAVVVEEKAVVASAEAADITR